MKKLTQYEFEQKVYGENNNIEILGKYVNSRTKIKTRCLKDGFEWEPSAKSLLNGHGCPVCNTGGKKDYAIKGISDYWTVMPEYAKYLKDKNDGYKYTKHSKHKTHWICPDCNNDIYCTFSQVSFCGLLCNKCGDGFSYPNKFIYNLLKQLKIDFISEYRIEDYYYDILLPDNYIVEMNGGFHYIANNMTGETLEQVLKKDNDKKLVANNHGYTVIYVDCKKSNMEYIKNSIMNSERLCELIRLNDKDIDWIDIDIKSSNSLLLRVSDLYNNGLTDTKDLCDQLYPIHKTTILRYLHRADKLGLCDFKPNHNRKRVLCITTGKEFESIQKAKNFYGMSSAARISMCCRGLSKYSGYDKETNQKLEWKYIDNS